MHVLGPPLGAPNVYWSVRTTRAKGQRKLGSFRESAAVIAAAATSGTVSKSVRLKPKAVHSRAA